MSSKIRSMKRAAAKEQSAKSTELEPLVLPADIGQQIRIADAEIAGLDNALRMKELLRENLILSAALEMGLTKARLSELELARENGNLVFRKPAESKEQSAETAATNG